MKLAVVALAQGNAPSRRRINPARGGAPPPMTIAFSTAQSRATCRHRYRLNLNSSAWMCSGPCLSWPTR